MAAESTFTDTHQAAWPLWRLDGPGTTLLLQGGQDQPHLLHFGAALPTSLDGAALAAVLERPRAHASLDRDETLGIAPGAGIDARHPAVVSGCGEEGGRWALRLSLQAVHHDSQANTLEFTLLDRAAELELRVRYGLMQDSGVLAIETQITNLAATSWRLDYLAAGSLPLPAVLQEAMLVRGRWGGEFQQRRVPLEAARLQIDNLTGRTSHEHIPACLVGSAGFSANQGEVIGTQLAHNGNFRLLIDVAADGQCSVQLGALALPGECTLGPGERHRSPTMLLCHSSQGSNVIAQRFHRYLRRSVLPAFTRTPRPVHANSWEAVYFDHRPAVLEELVEAAAAIGAERFVLDDGWFSGRTDDKRALGDWQVDSGRYPQGFEPLRRQLRELGLQFGLWFEPEMVSPDSDRYRDAPHTALHVAAHEPITGRDQLVLNIADPAVMESLYEQIVELLERWQIDYIKWDHNRILLPAADARAPVALAQADAVLRLMRRLCERFPQLEIESCASGGGRVDAAMFSVCGRAWSSDNIDPIERLAIQRGFLQFFPPEVMGSHVGADKAHLTGRVSDLDTRAIVALQGQYGFEFDARVPDAATRERLSHYTHLYKRHRHWLAESCYWQLPTRDPALYASGRVAADGAIALFDVVAAAAGVAMVPERLRLCGLNDSDLYDVSELSHAAERLAPYARSMPSWLAESQRLSGRVLNCVGLQLPVLPAQQALLIECRRVDLTTGEIERP